MAQANFLERAAIWTGRQMQKRVPYADDNVYLTGPYAPVADEVTETALRVSGALPRELNGLYARIGPNPMQVDNPATYHWFVGDGMVHGVRLRDGRALWYRNRWVGTDSVRARLGRAALPGPRHGVADVVNTNIIGHNGRLWAMVEAGAQPVEMDGELNTLRHGCFDRPQPRAFSAHPHRDPMTGELHAICYDAMDPHHLHHVAVDADARLLRDIEIPVRHGPMVHDCALTHSHVLVFDLPVTFSVATLLRGGTFPYRWNPRHAARVGLLPRTGTAVEMHWFEVDPCYVFHAANARDLPDGGVEVDVVTHPRMFDDKRPTGPAENHSRLERWTLDDNSGRVKRKPWSDLKQEFPRYDERRTGLPYRYVYTVGADIDPIAPQPLYRHDLHTGQVQHHRYGPRHITGEAVFVPRRADAAEDDGWLLSYVYDRDKDTSALVILNAADVDGEPQAVVSLPRRVPLGFHGNWIADTGS